VVYIPKVGGFDTYYYDGDDEVWKTTSPVSDVVAANIPIVYTDGIIVFNVAPESVVVTGEIKTESVNSTAMPGFNYLGSIYPVGATLETAFGANTSTSITPGFGGPTGADVVYVPKVGGFDTYYYDGDDLVWKTTSPVADVDAALINLPSSVIYFSAAGSAINLVQTPAAIYSSL
jgi:hypothetical protein